MTPLAVLLALGCQVFNIVGQVLLKRAMDPKDPARVTRAARAATFAGGIACLTAWFFVWLGLLADWELSKVFPFEGLNPTLVVLAAWLFLRERLSVTAWVGVGLVTAGVVLV
ncbi:MAG TPA: EamA family transporter, partial [Humisphaera sp.]